MIYDFLLTWFYQPLFNLLIFLYTFFNFIYPGISIGAVVVIFTLIFRFAILPLSWKSDYSEAERRRIAKEVAEIERLYKDDPKKIKDLRRQVIWKNKRLVFMEIFNLTLQVGIALFLFKFFSTGITGADNNLVYSIINPPENINTYFMGIDLNHPSFKLNLINSVVIFIVEALSLWNRPFPVTRSDLSTMIFLPIIAFIFFGRMPAGKKLFVITTLIFTICIIIVKRTLYLYHKIKEKLRIKPKESLDENDLSVSDRQDKEG